MKIKVQDSNEEYTKHVDGFILACKENGFISINADGITYEEGCQMITAIARSLDKHRLGD